MVEPEPTEGESASERGPSCVRSGTERYYARLRTDKPFEAIDALFQAPVVPSKKP